MRSNRKYALNEYFFENINSQEKAYWLGFIAADGCIYKTGGAVKPKVLSFNLNERDKGHLEKFLKSIDSSAQIKIQEGRGFGQGTLIAHLEINSTKMCEDLQKHGILERKSLILQPPTITSKYYNAWIRGYIDGDGSISLLANGNFQIGLTGTKEVLNFINNNLSPVRPRALTQKHKDIEHNNWSLNIGGTNLVVQYLHQIYDNSTIYLERKYQKVLEIYSRFEK